MELCFPALIGANRQQHSQTATPRSPSGNGCGISNCSENAFAIEISLICKTAIREILAHGLKIVSGGREDRPHSASYQGETQKLLAKCSVEAAAGSHSSRDSRSRGWGKTYLIGYRLSLIGLPQDQFLALEARVRMLWLRRQDRSSCSTGPRRFMY